MKIRKILALATPLTMVLATTPVLLTSCNTNKTPVVYKAETKVVPYYQTTMGSQLEPVYMKVSGLTQKVTHFNDSPIPYIDLDETFNTAEMTARTAHGKTVITNLYNFEWVVIDYANQTIQFSDWDKNIDLNPNSYGPLTEGCGGGNNYYYSVKQTKYYAGKTQTLDLSYYGMKAYLYKDEFSMNDVHGYIPYHLIKNLLNLSLVNLPCDYNGNGFYEIAKGKSANSVEYMKLVRESSGDYYNNRELMEYYYNLLALTLDCRFGLIERQSRATPGKLIKYFPNGAYAMLAKYHDRLVSTEPNVSAEALREIFTQELDDGGHARYVHLNAFSTEPYAEAAEQGEETKHTFAIDKKLLTARNDAGISEGGVVKKQYQEYENADKTKKIAYITFDAFESESWVTAKEADICDERKIGRRELPECTNESNYMDDTMRLTMYANKKIKADPTIKDVVVDISANGGGTVYTEHFIASWLCGGVTEKIYNPTTGAYCEYEVKADINADGQFDENDTIADLNLYVITSSTSFSCGNMLPCNIADNRDMSAVSPNPKTVIMGTKSGGGACFVDDQIFVGPQTYTRSSSIFHMLRNASLHNNYITVDTGAPISSGWEIDDMADDVSAFYDRATINKKIWDNQ